jgi:hypothetical protein
LRTETTINNPWDFRVNKDWANWPYLRQLASAINQRRLETERVSPDCRLSAESLARVSQPTATETGQRAPGLRFGQPRVMALFAALSRFAPSWNGFRHGDLRPIVQPLRNSAPDAYTTSQRSYDLRRLRLKGLSARMQSSHTDILTRSGRRVAYLMTKLHQRSFNLAGLALADELPATLAAAFRQFAIELERLVANAALAPAGI